MGDERTAAVDTRSGTPGEIVGDESYGYRFFQPYFGGPEWQVDSRWISTDKQLLKKAWQAVWAKNYAGTTLDPSSSSPPCSYTNSATGAARIAKGPS